jgi:RNA recognition motif-containing protein
MPFHPDFEKTKRNISELLERIKSEADPVLLNEYRSVFKKGIPLFSRSYASAYLLMLYDQEAGRSGRGRGTSDRYAGSGAPKFQREGRRESRGKAPEARKDFEGGGNRYPLPAEESKFLFISIGRNRRVFPREILALIGTKTSVPREDIGSIRIFDNYSFVQVRDTAADEIIEALNGKPFRGRPLTVNHARTRRDEAPPESGGESRYDDEHESGSRVPYDSDDTADKDSPYEGGNDADDYDEGGGTDGEGLNGGLEQDDDQPDKENI